MIKCYFIDIKNISSDLPRSNFRESDLEQLATLILAAGGLIRPLILKESGIEKYTIVAGHLEYYAAVKAKEWNASKAEMVNAFVINDQIQSSVIEQLQLLAGDRSPVTITPITSDINQLLPTIIEAVSQQIQPLVKQLAEQQKILELLTFDRITAANIQPTEILSIQPLESKDTASTLISNIVVEPTQSKIAKIKPETIKPKAPKAEKNKIEKINSVQLQPAKTNTSKTKKTSIPLSSIDLIKATNALNLINNLSQDDLILKMERSGVSKTVIKLVPNIITSRNSQPNQKFDTWETITVLKIKGLGAATIKGIIDKLK